MKDKEWRVIAVLDWVADGGSQYLGFSHSIEGAKKICDTKRREDFPDDPLTWRLYGHRDGAPSPNEESNDKALYTFIVFWDEVQN